MTTSLKENTTAQALPAVSGWEPSATDRCDACGVSSRAYIRASKGDSEMFFCGHHNKVHGSALIIQGFNIEDRTDILEEQERKYKAVSDDNF